MENKLTAINILSLLDTTKEQRQSFVQDVIERMEAGEVDALKVHCQIKSMENIIDVFTDKKNITGKQYSDLVLESAQRYGSKSFDLHNGKFQIKEAGVVYDWSKCEDNELVELLAKQDELKVKIKLKQDFLKNVPLSGLLVTIEETGETYKVYPPSKTSTTVVSVQIK